MYPDLVDILGLLEDIAPSCLAESWDNTGFQAGNLSAKIYKILISLDPTLKAVQAASLKKAQLLFSHHPLIFSPISSLDTSIYPGNVIRAAIQNDIGVVAAHTNLDAACGGINDILAKLFHLKDIAPLKPHKSDRNAGIGRIGKTALPLKLTDLAEYAKEGLGTDRLRIVHPTDKTIQRVAVVGGSGGSLICTAYEKGADVIITGDIGHHHALEAKSYGITVIDAGHFGTEKPAFMIFAQTFKKIIADLGWETAVELFEDEDDPITYSVEV